MKKLTIFILSLILIFMNVTQFSYAKEDNKIVPYKVVKTYSGTIKRLGKDFNYKVEVVIDYNALIDMSTDRIIGIDSINYSTSRSQTIGSNFEYDHDLGTEVHKIDSSGKNATVRGQGTFTTTISGLITLTDRIMYNISFKAGEGKRQ